ncbi:kinase-like domain-containing protein [Aspergillus aurantiobrunneus]
MNISCRIFNTIRVLHEPIEYVERMEYYRPGGYHPVTIVGRFHNRHQIVHKLGHSTYSTTWLARDERSNRYVAVEVCTADSNPLEVDILSKLSKPQQVSDRGRAMIPLIWDRFSVQGPNGNHVCLVARPARMSLSDAKNGSWISLFQLEVTRALAAQIVIMVQYLHLQRVVHGDLYCQGPPPGVPQHGIILVWPGKESKKVALPKARILLSDFGETFPPSTRESIQVVYTTSDPSTRGKIQTNQASLSFSSDIWSLGCIIWHVVAQRTLFEGFLTNEDDTVCQHIDLLGQLPTEWWEKWEARRDKFTDSGDSIHPAQFQNRTWEERFDRNVQQPRRREGMPFFESDEREALLSMLSSMLSFRAEDRPSAGQVLKSDWMAKWALPKCEKVCDAQQYRTVGP